MGTALEHAVTVIVALAAVTILGVTGHISGDGLVAIISGLTGVGFGAAVNSAATRQ